jgi:adenylylsulfate kinase-like enzyme
VKKILIMGLPGAGKTTLSKILASLLNAVHFNADDVRKTISKDLGFSIEDRIEQAQRMSWLCDTVVKSGNYAIADFVCPTLKTRETFGDAFVVWLDRISISRFRNTNEIFEAPQKYDVRITNKGTPEYWAYRIVKIIKKTVRIIKKIVKRIARKIVKI